MSTTRLVRGLAGAALCCVWLCTDAWSQAPFIRGDVNCDGVVDGNDVNALNGYLYGGAFLACDDAADVNDDGSIDVSDVSALLNYINTGQPVPPPPFPGCGYDPTPDALTCASYCCGVERNHFKAWRLQPQPFNLTVSVKDQFMTDQLQLVGIEYLANPAQKDTYPIVWPDDHLTWYRAGGRDTVLNVEFYNQFGLDTVVIDAVTHLLVPTQKMPHLPPSTGLDHYKAYRIRNPQPFVRVTHLIDQFDPVPEMVDQLAPLYFLTPASKNGEPIQDTILHYVAYDLVPKTSLVNARSTVDQFGVHTLEATLSDLLLVPTYKLKVWSPATPPDTLKNHFKTWRVHPSEPFSGSVMVHDQFMTDQVLLSGIEFLSNPCEKDTSLIRRPNDHLDWYRATGQPTRLRVEYENQFGHGTVVIDSVTHLLVPCRKDPHPKPDSLLGHYKSYRIANGTTYIQAAAPVRIMDQFDIAPEFLDSLVPRYFLTPAIKNTEPAYGSDTHYVAYEIFPKTMQMPPVPTVVTDDQFGTRQLGIINSELLLVPTRKISWGPPPADTLKNHFKSWRIEPPAPFSGLAVVQDQFGTDQLFLSGIEYLSNPATKDTSAIRRPDDHLNWYKAVGQHATNLQVEYSNQFHRGTILIGPVTHLLVPCRKDPHPRPDSLLGHYTAYQVLNPAMYRRDAATGPVVVQDQFDAGVPELIDSLLPRYFLAPARKNTEPQYGSDTHYVAYEIFPKTALPTLLPRLTEDQFGSHQLPISQSELLLVPSKKVAWGPPPDTTRNHYKGWRLDPIPFPKTVSVVDPFMSDVVTLDSIEYLANPARKDNDAIINLDNHLLWYGADGRDTCIRIVLNNQFGLDTLMVGTVSYLILPAQKLPHLPPDPRLDHYKAYQVFNPTAFLRVTQVEDQFNLVPETIDRLLPKYFCTPVSKNGEPIYDPVTHYVAYELFPKLSASFSRTAVDQFGSHDVKTQYSDLLMVPTRKLASSYFCPITLPGDVNCSGVVSSADIIVLVNYVFKGGAPPCPCAAAGDIDCNGSVTSADIIKLVNYVFKSGLPPCDPCTVIPSLWICPC